MKNKQFDSYLKKIEDDNVELKNLIKRVIKKGDLYIIGGALRDFYFYDLDDYKIRDLDLVFSEKIVEIEEILKEYSYCKNRFGGYKLKLKNLSIDIWSYYDSWAFKNKLIKGNKCNLSNLARGTYLNIDSLVYNYNNSQIYNRFFKEVLEKKEIEFVIKNKDYIEENPNSNINIIKMLYMKKKYNLNLSTKIKEYIIKYSEKNYEKLYSSQFQHYNKKILEKEEIKTMIEEILENTIML